MSLGEQVCTWDEIGGDMRLQEPGQVDKLPPRSSVTRVRVMNEKTKWNIEADFVQACSCDFGCPCEFSAPPTRGYCEGLGAWRIARGNFGDVPLGGLALAFVARWPGAIH